MISVIICTYNRASYLRNTLARIAGNRYDKRLYELLLIDNNSTDETCQVCDQFKAVNTDVRFRYFLETQQGLSYARNRGIQESCGEILVFLDDDAYVSPDYLHNLSCDLDRFPEVVAFGGKITLFFDTCDAPKWLCKWSYSWLSAIDKGSKVVPFKKKEYPIGANMGFKRSVIEKCGMFNTSLGRIGKSFIGGEEKDYFNRVKLYGPVLYFPDIEVLHVIPESRTSADYVKRLALGIGVSERIRSKSDNSFVKRCVLEMVKWGGTVLIGIKYFLQGKKECGSMLFVFRWNVSKGLFYS